MKKMLMVVVMVMLIIGGYIIGELIIPQSLNADKQPQVHTGKKVSYNGLPSCYCDNINEDCLCLINW